MRDLTTRKDLCHVPAHVHTALFLRLKNGSCSFFDFLSGVPLSAVKMLNCIFLFLFSFSLPLDAKEPKESKGSLSFPERALIRMERGEFSDKDVRELEKLSKKGDVAAVAVLAQFHGEFAENLPAALQLLCPLLLDKTVSDEMIRICSDKKAEHSEILLKIPPSSGWRKEQPLACVAMARILALNGKYAAATAAFDLVGMNTQGLTQALAAEGVGDMNIQLKRWKDSVGGYEFALKALANTRNRSEFEAEKDSIAVVESRIKRKLAKAQKMWDSERYGPEFVAYREARRADLDGDHAIAVLRYSQIESDYPDTVYSEAAGLYGPLCLLKLSEPDAKKSLQKRTEEKEEKLRGEIKKLKSLSKNIAQRLVAEWQELVDEDQKILEELKKIPIAKKAEKDGISQLENFIAKNEFGLYRAEAMLSLGNHFLENLEIETAFRYFDRAVAWIDENAEASKALSRSFTVPEKARLVTAPPLAMHSRDEWGNTQWSAVGPEVVFNQNSCPWYFDWLRYGLYSKRALCSSLLGKKQAALEDIKVILDSSPFEKMMFEKGFPNSYNRLKNAFENETMFATKEELKAFKGKSRTATIVAGYYYEIEDWRKAFDLFTRYRAEFGKSFNKDANAYFDLMTGTLFLILGSIEKRRDFKDKGLEILSIFAEKEYEDTPTWPRGVFALFSRWQSEKGKEEDALALLRKVSRKLPQSEYGKRAYYHQAEYLYNVLKRSDEAEGIFKDVKEKFSGTWLARGAEQYLAIISKTKK